MTSGGKKAGQRLAQNQRKSRDRGVRRMADVEIGIVDTEAQVLRLLPLTGITLPFVSYGGSSLVTNFLLVALVWAISGERRKDAE